MSDLLALPRDVGRYCLDSAVSGVPVSPDRLLRLLRTMTGSDAPTPRVLGVDDLALHCWSETIVPSAHDEPYVVFSAVSPTRGRAETRTQINTGVDAGESVADSIELYRGRLYGLLLISVLMEHDYGDPDHFRDAVTGATAAAGAAVTAAVTAIPVAGPPLALVVLSLMVELVPAVADAINDLLGIDDDRIGQRTQSLTASRSSAVSTPYVKRTGHASEKQHNRGTLRLPGCACQDR